MSWNYRLFKFDGDEEDLIYISEAYYFDDGIGFVNPKECFSTGLFSVSTKEDMKDQLDYITLALERPIIIINNEFEILREEE